MNFGVFLWESLPQISDNGEYIFVGNDFLKALMTFDGFDFMLFDQIWLLIGDAETTVYL